MKRDGCYRDLDRLKKKERLEIVEEVKKTMRKRKPSPKTKRCYGCGFIGRYITSCPIVICLCHNG